MITAYFIMAVVAALLIALGRTRVHINIAAGAFFVLQAAFAVWMFSQGEGAQWLIFSADKLALLLFAIMSTIAVMVFWTGTWYMNTESVPVYRLYHIFLVLLCGAMTGVYLSDNLAVTWVFMELTTLCAAGLVYHRRTSASLEATWKYLFVCSTGIAIAYLGILLLSTAATWGDLTYDSLAWVVSHGNPLYMKIAFLFILVGYSCKMEVFPLYTVGVDANSAAPAPASALISTALVNAGFVAVYRAYRLFVPSEIFPWVCNVLIIAGVISVLLGVLFIRRTNHYKRMLAYSTVENMGIVLIGMGIGGVGLFAALLHITAHSLIKSGIMLQMARVGRTYGTYRINRIGGYMKAEPLGAVTLLVLAIMLLAFPPSPLFLSELMILGQAVEVNKWWVVITVVALVCVVMYNLCNRILRLCYKPGIAVATEAGGRAVRWLPVVMLFAAIALGVWQGRAFVEFLNGIVQ